FMRKMSERQSQIGIEGIKRKFEKARADVNATLQQAGATFYETVSEDMEQMINRITGVTVKETRKDVAEAFRTMMGGGAIGAAAAGQTFGLGGRGTIGSDAGGLGRQMFGAGADDLKTFNDADAGHFADAGFAFKGGSLASHL